MSEVGGISEAEVAMRIDQLQTPYLKQADALFRKNLSFQKKRRLTNCCLVLAPILVIGLILCVQYIFEVLFLGKPRVRCPYCGPADDAYGKTYCAGYGSCQEFFFPNASRVELRNKFKVDVVEECAALSKTCGGTGNFSCFKPEWSRGFQIAFCPFQLAPSQPGIGYMPPPQYASKTPLLYTSDADPAKTKVVDSVMGKMFDVKHTDENTASRKLRASMHATTSLLFQMLVAVPLAGCASLDVSSTLSTAQEQAVCKLLQHGQGDDEQPCCVDLTDNGVGRNSDSRNLGLGNKLAFKGRLVAGINYWSPTPLLHNDSVYNASMRACMQGKTLTECNAVVIGNWTRQGARFGSGSGKQQIASMLTKMLGSLAGTASLTGGATAGGEGAGGGGGGGGGAWGGGQGGLVGVLLGLLGGSSQFRCVAPVFSTEVQTRINGGNYAQGVGADASGDKCVNLQEGLAILAKYVPMPATVHPAPEPTKDIPDCSRKGDCAQRSVQVQDKERFLLGGGRWAQVCEVYERDILSHRIT
jgi:hypothetical protein